MNNVENHFRAGSDQTVGIPDELESTHAPAEANPGGTQLLPEEADEIAGGGIIENHNENVPADLVTERDAEELENEELLPDEADVIAGGGIAANHNQTLPAQ